jgi:Uma2 family endonuclease
MSAAAWNDRFEQYRELLEHEGPWTEEAYLALPETASPRIELLDGSLLVTPWAGGGHQLAVYWLSLLLGPATPTGMLLLPGGNVRVTPDTFLIPDIILTTQTDPDVVYYEGREIVLAGEIVSPGSAGADRWTKPRRYAQAGIDWYMRVELKGPRAPKVILYRRVDEKYVEHVQASAGQQFHIDGPISVAFDPAILKSRRQGSTQ